LVHSHPRPSLLQALADGEVGPRKQEALSAHVESCASCREQLEEIRALSRGFALAVRHIDATGEAALARLAASPPSGVPTATAPSRGTRMWARAAGVVLMIGGTAAAAGLSGMWLRDRLLGPTPTASAPSAETLPENGSPPLYESGTGFLPAGNNIAVDLAGLAAGSRVEIALADSDSVWVAVRSTEGPVRYNPGGAAIRASVSGRADVTISLPRSIESASITVNGDMRAVKRGGRIEFPETESGDVIVVRSGS
jgi:hypothetical protein